MTPHERRLAAFQKANPNYRGNAIDLEENAHLYLPNHQLEIAVDDPDKVWTIVRESGRNRGRVTASSSSYIPFGSLDIIGLGYPVSRIDSHLTVDSALGYRFKTDLYRIKQTGDRSYKYEPVPFSRIFMQRTYPFSTDTLQEGFVHFSKDRNRFEQAVDLRRQQDGAVTVHSANISPLEGGHTRTQLDTAIDEYTEFLTTSINAVFEGHMEEDESGRPTPAVRLVLGVK